MAEFTAWSVACPAAAPYLYQISERPEQEVEELINMQRKDCKDDMQNVHARIPPILVYKLE